MTDSSVETLAPVEDFIKFEVRDGMHSVVCHVSQEALDFLSDLSGPPSVTTRRKSFNRFRTLIDKAAKLKLKTRGVESIGPMILSSVDLRWMLSDADVPSFIRMKVAFNR